MPTPVIPVVPTGLMSLSPTADAGLPVSLPSIVQKAGGVSTTQATTLAQAFSSSNTIGNTIVVVAGAGSNGTLSVADTSGNTYISATSGASGATFETQIFFAPITLNPSSGFNTVTLTTTVSADLGVEIYEVVGLLSLAGAVLDQVGINNATSTAVTTSSTSPTSPNEVAFLAIGVGTGTSTIVAVAGTPWTVDQAANPTSANNLFSFGSASALVGSIAQFTPKATLGTSRPWCACAATFRAVQLPVQGTMFIGGYNYTHIAGAATTLVKTGAGVLHSITLNSLIASATVEADDALTHTNAMAIITTPATLVTEGPLTAIYDIQFNTGLTIFTVTAVDITVAWR